MEKYQKIDTMYKRYIFNGSDCPNKNWLKFKNKIILGEFSNKEAKYLFTNLWEAYSKIDGTNCKIAYFPSTCEIRVEGKDEKSQDQQGMFNYLTELGEKMRPELMKMFPKETAKFVPVKGADNKVQYYYGTDGSAYVEPHNGFVGVELEEVPIYIYGEYFGDKIQKCGKRYLQNAHDFAVFDIKMQGWWTPKDYRDALCKGLGLNQVPFLGVMTLEDIEKKVRDGFTTQYEKAADPTLIEEGIVARPIIPLFSNGNNRVIVKVKYCDYIEYDTVRKEFSDEEFNEFNKWYAENIEA